MGFLKVKNKKTGKTFDTSTEEWESTIASKGLAYKYEIVEDGAPIEIKTMREKKKNEESVVGEVVLKKKKQKEEKDNNG